MVYSTDCKMFTGYKPCEFKRSCKGCPHYSPVESRILIISLAAMGAVIRSTCLLAPIRRRYPNAHITWVTLKNSKPLLENNKDIDLLLSLSEETTTVLRYLEFDVCFAVDKSLEAGALAETARAKEKFGFGLSPAGFIRPLNVEAQYQYNLGLDDYQKFVVNQKAETQQITESMGLEWSRDKYRLDLTEEEKEEILKRRGDLLYGRGEGIIGYNTGCSTIFPNKKFRVEKAIETVRQGRKSFPNYHVVLLGGREDASRQKQIKAAFIGDPCVINTPTDGGLRSGMLWIATADVVFSGCSLGMHIAIALQKKVVAWFGVSCIQEIDLYDQGVKLQADVSCSPCWKKKCDQTIKCFDQVDVQRIVHATQSLLTPRKATNLEI